MDSPHPLTRQKIKELLKIEAHRKFLALERERGRWRKKKKKKKEAKYSMSTLVQN